jgi:mono/diheme cytochrome c family protein
MAALSMTSCAYDSREEINALEPCNTTFVTFQLTIRPILNNNCIVCHSGESPANGLDYTKYSDVLMVASDGRLVGAINHRAGFEPMPRFAPKLPSCEIQKIEKWVNEGALNN